MLAAGAGEPATLTVSLSDKAPSEHGQQCCGGEVTVLLEPLRVVPAVAVFGVGHVGLELARILARHDIELHLVDSRADALARSRLAVLDDAVARVHVHHSPVPEVALGQVPAGTHVLVMTHDHAEDAAICDAALRCAHLGSIGLIGSSAKWARFEALLRREGHDEAAVRRIQSPIGQRGLTGKEPATIALSVAAELLAQVEFASRRRRIDRVVVTIVRGTFLDTPTGETAIGAALRADADAALRVVDGTIVERGSWADLSAGGTPDDDVLDLREGLVLPGLVDTHVHYPQVRVTGALGLPLLEWLDAVALPEEARLASPDYARAVAREFVAGLADAGTTTALVFGSHFASAVDVLFDEVQRAGLRVTAGLVVGDRGLPEALLTTPERAYDESVALARRWHHAAGAGAAPRPRYAVTPRFSYGATDGLLESCQSVLKDVPGSWFTSHVNESPAEIAAVASLFPDAADYVDTYDRHGLVGPSSVLAHNVHPTARELALLAGQGASVAHCPTSNAALGSGLFPLRAHVDHGVRVSLGSDVGAGTGFSLFKEGLQAYFVQQLLGDAGPAARAGRPAAPRDPLGSPRPRTRPRGG